MSTLISILVTYNQLLLSQINQLLIFITKNIPLKAPKYDITNPKYKIANSKDKKPVNPRGKNPVAPDTVCPRCSAPHNYIYDNAGGRGQLCCKVYDFHFS